MKPAVAGTLSFFALTTILACSRSLGSPQALEKFEQTPAFTVLSHGIRPDGSSLNVHHPDGSSFVDPDGFLEGDGEALKSLVVTDIVQVGTRAAVHFRFVFDLTPTALKTVRTQRQKSGVSPVGNNDVCLIDERNSQAICEAAWVMTHYDDGWRYDNPTLNGALKFTP
jgi:hypothetical protein